MALYYSKGKISAMSEVKSGTGQSGFAWQRMTLTLEVQEYGGFIKKQIFQVSGEEVDEVLKYKVGDSVQVGFSLYAREWNGKWFNNVDLVNITTESGAVKSAPVQEAVEAETPDLPF